MTTFLTWTAMPEHDERKLMGVKACIVLSIMFVFSAYMKRLKWVALSGVTKRALLCRRPSLGAVCHRLRRRLRAWRWCGPGQPRRPAARAAC